MPLPRSGTEAAIGAVVLLGRDAGGKTPPLLEPVSDDDAIAALVLQNFGRQVHAGAILPVSSAVARTVPVYRLVYDSVAEAAAYLHDNADLASLPAAALPASDLPLLAKRAPVAQDMALPAGALDPDLTYCRVSGFVATQTDVALYLADAQGRAIHRLNAVLAEIWLLLEQPQRADDLAGMLRDVFPAVAPARLKEDAVLALQFLWDQYLVVAGNTPCVVCP